MAGNSSIGAASLVISANADQLVGGLNRAEAMTAKSGARMKANLSGGGGAGGKGGGLLDSLGGVGGLAARAGGWAAVGVALFQFSKFASGANDRMRDQKHAVEDLARTHDELARSLDRSLKRQDEWVNALSDPKARGAALEKQVEATERMVNEQKAAADAARNELRRLESSDGRVDNAWLALQGKLEGTKGKLTEELKFAESAASKLGDRLADLREKKMRALDPTKNPELLGEINRLTDSLKLQQATLGMTGNQAQIYALKMKGATSEQLAAAQKIADELDALDQKTEEAAAGGPKLGGAFQAGTAEAYSIVAKFQTGNMQQADTAKKQLDEAKRATAALLQVVAALKNAPVIKAI